MQSLANAQTGADQLSTLAARIQNIALLHQAGAFTTRLSRNLDVATVQLTADIEAALDRLDPIITEAIA